MLKRKAKNTTLDEELVLLRRENGRERERERNKAKSKKYVPLRIEQKQEARHHAFSLHVHFLSFIIMC